MRLKSWLLLSVEICELAVVPLMFTDEVTAALPGEN